MTAKEWLSRGRGIDREIEMLERERERALTDATSATAPPDGERVQTSRRNTAEDRFIRYADYVKAIDERHAELAAVKQEIFTVISRVEDRNQRLVLELYYIENVPTWNEIAEIMKKELRQIFRIRKNALNAVEKTLWKI